MRGFESSNLRHLVEKGVFDISAVIMNCKELAAIRKACIKERVEKMPWPPKLAVVLVGDNPASLSYVRGKEKDCAECGIKCEVIRLDEDRITTDTLVRTIQELNEDNCDGILVQLPLPDHVSTEAVLKEINPFKDVDGFNPQNLGELVINRPFFMPCTPLGIMDILDHFDIEVEGKNCVVIGRSNIVGKPMSLMMTNAGATVTLCHSHTKNLPDITKRADIIICAVGKEKFLTADMVNENAVVIDVGINRNSNGKLCGDVDFENVSKKCAAITPVPGGVGLMTRAALLENIMLSYDYN